MSEVPTAVEFNVPPAVSHVPLKIKENSGNSSNEIEHGSKMVWLNSTLSNRPGAQCVMSPTPPSANRFGLAPPMLSKMRVPLTDTDTTGGEFSSLTSNATLGRPP